MKAIIEIELEIDGEWKPEDKEELIDLILSAPHQGVWEVDEGRLAIIAKSMSAEIVEEP